MQRMKGIKLFPMQEERSDLANAPNRFLYVTAVCSIPFSRISQK